MSVRIHPKKANFKQHIAADGQNMNLNPQKNLERIDSGDESQD